MNYESRGTYNTNSQIRFENSMLRSSLYDYSKAYILVKGTITVANTAAQDQESNGALKKVYLKIVRIYQLRKQNKQYTNRWCSIY